ncbi:MAG: plasmid mobilization relaxosome protein MobC [Lachnospiraceae bacterium]|nr:plasmid mobilization relaxosome protein MobC [Lachnospiraceae bacterium]
MRKNAEANGLNPSEYVRELILNGGTIDTSFAIDRRDLINQISKVGNNINQLTRLANTNRLVSDHILKQIVDLLKEIQKLMMEVVKKWR